MPSYVTPKINTAFIFYISLVSQADTKIMQANPTLAAGDVKVAVDDAAPANLATLPAVDADFTKRVKVSLSTAEMNGDNITIIFSDAAGAEWCDQTVNLQTSARQIDDLAFPTVTGRSLDVTATGAAGIDWANVENPTTAVDLSSTDIQLVDTATAVGSVSGAVGSVTGAVGSVTGNVGGDVQGNVDGSVATIGPGGVIDGAIAAAELANIADALLDRRLDLGVDNGGNTTTTRTWRQALRAMRNRVAIAGGTMTVYEEDDVTSDWTAAVTTAAGDPISELNPS